MKVVLNTIRNHRLFAAAAYLWPVALVIVLVFLAVAGVLAVWSTSVTGNQTHVQSYLLRNETSDAFVKKLIHSAGARVDADGAITVKLAKNVCYRLYNTTYQELAVLDSSLLHLIMRQLDAQGIEYEVLKNNSDVFLIAKCEWLVSWGGLLFVPDVPTNF